MAFVKGRGIKVEVALTSAATKSVSAITKASPGVATSTAHGLTADTIGVFSAVGGMVQLEGQAVRVKNVAANTFELQGLNTSTYSDFSGTATLTPVATWSTLAECDSYDIGGGASADLDVTCLIDVIEQLESGNLAAQSFSLTIKSTDAPSAAMQALEAAAMSGSQKAMRITLPGGAVRVLNGEPSLSGESVSTGQVGSGTLSVKVKGIVLKLAA